MKKYYQYKQRFIQDKEFQQDRSLNWNYDLSFFLDYPEYQLQTLTVIDWEQLIPTNKLLDENKRLLIAEYDENILSQEIINQYISTVPTEFNLVEIINPIEWIKTNTTLEQLTDNSFLIHPEMDWIMWVISEKILVIE